MGEKLPCKLLSVRMARKQCSAQRLWRDWASWWIQSPRNWLLAISVSSGSHRRPAGTKGSGEIRSVSKTMSDRSAVMALIGAGPVGLGMAKALLEHKIPYEQLEADRELGGNWLHGVYETVHIISSRRTTEYADYPMPADYPDFPSRQQMLDYLRDYAQKFQLTPHIQFNTKVVMALPLADGRW